VLFFFERIDGKITFVNGALFAPFEMPRVKFFLWGLLFATSCYGEQ